MKKALLVFNENKAHRYGFPKFQKTLTGDIIHETEVWVSIIPLACRRKKARNIRKSDIKEIRYF